MAKLQGRVALVTGADSGMGQAIAIDYAKEGAAVCVTYRSDAEGAAKTKAGIEAAGGKALVLQLDVREEAAVTEAFAQIEAKLGTVDILVANAGTGNSGSPVRDTETDEFDRVVRTNLYGTFFCCREYLRRRGEREGGKIIVVTSVHDSIPSPNMAAYGASKGGLLTFVRSLCLEVAPQKINVNAIAPGLIATPMTLPRLQDPEEYAREMKEIPLGRPGKPEEIAALAVYLASADSDYVTGQNFVIDGGLEMNWGQGA